MVTLRRTVRLAINTPASAGDDPPSYNAYAAGPSPIGLARVYELEAACLGEPDPRTGYLINITEIDRAVRQAALPLLTQACTGDATAHANPPDLLAKVHARLASLLPVPCTALTLRLSPHHAFEVRPAMPTNRAQASTAASAATPGVTALIRTAFDLAAAHRLHSPALSPEENRATFGKCNNPSGHGHNYRVEPCVEIDLSHPSASAFTIQALEHVTDETLISRFDHKHLNLDTPEFSDAGGLNPTVENIARVFYSILSPAIRSASPAATLNSITVWETDRTCATFPG